MFAPQAWKSIWLLQPGSYGGSRFLQTDPVAGGSANDYDYSGQDPVNQFDLDGRCVRGFGWACKAGSVVKRGAVASYDYAERHPLDVALAAATFAPGVGEAAWAVRLAWAARGVRVIRGAEDAGIVGKVEYNSLKYGSRRFLKLDRPDTARPYYHWVHGKYTGRGGERAFGHYSKFGRSLD